MGPCLRQPSTLEETLAWQIRVCGLPDPKRQYRFGDRKWAIDFAWPDHKLAVELEGGIFRSLGRKANPRGGWHQSIQRYLSDMEKHNALNIAGWTLLRYAADRVENGDALMEIESVLKGK